MISYHICSFVDLRGKAPGGPAALLRGALRDGAQVLPRPV